MTEEQFDEATKGGKVQLIEPESSGSFSAPSSDGSEDISQYIPLLEALRTVTNFLSSAPTTVPETFQDQVQFGFDGTNYYLYLWINNSWQTFPLAAGGVTQISAGIGISIAPTSGKGVVIVTNNGVTSLIAGTGISVSASSGDVTISATSTTVSRASGYSSWAGNSYTMQTIAHGLGKVPAFVRMHGSAGLSGTVGCITSGTYNGTIAYSTTLSWYTAGAVSGGGTVSGYILQNNNPASGGGGNEASITVDATNIYLTWHQVGSGNTLTLGFIWDVEG